MIKKLIILGLMLSFSAASEEVQIHLPKIKESKTENISKFANVPSCDTFSESQSLGHNYITTRYVKAFVEKIINGTKEWDVETDDLIDGERTSMSVCYEKDSNSILVKIEKVTSKILENPTIDVFKGGE